MPTLPISVMNGDDGMRGNQRWWSAESNVDETQRAPGLCGLGGSCYGYDKVMYVARAPRRARLAATPSRALSKLLAFARRGARATLRYATHIASLLFFVFSHLLAR